MLDQLGNLASGILVTEFDNITGYGDKVAELNLISGYLGESIGTLNILINQSYALGTGSIESNGRVVPPLKDEEASIMAKMYMKDYYYKLARNTLRGLATYSPSSAPTSADLWTEVREGDSFIRRIPLVASPTVKERSARVINDLAKDMQKDLDKMVHYYNMYGALPRQVFGTDVYNAWGNYIESPGNYGKYGNY